MKDCTYLRLLTLEYRPTFIVPRDAELLQLVGLFKTIQCMLQPNGTCLAMMLRRTAVSLALQMDTVLCLPLLWACERGRFCIFLGVSHNSRMDSPGSTTPIIDLLCIQILHHHCSCATQQSSLASINGRCCTRLQRSAYKQYAQLRSIAQPQVGC